MELKFQMAEAISFLTGTANTSEKFFALPTFTLGINTNLRASDILKITVGQVKNIQVGEHFTIKEQKTGKERSITMNKNVHDAIQRLLGCMPDANGSELLFQSRKSKERKAIVKKDVTVRQPSEREITESGDTTVSIGELALPPRGRARSCAAT